ncbi:MAG: GNAT family N-acyltransferase [Pseudomonadota bacterium]
MSHKTQKARPFSLQGVINTLPNRRINQAIEGLLEKTFGLTQLQGLYDALPPTQDDRVFLQQVFDTFNIRYQTDDAALARIPRTGPAIIVANHPFGAIEGVILAALLREVRSDVKIMANFVLSRIPELRELFISVDPFGSQAATQANIMPLKQAIRWVQQGGLLVVFPAGEVSHFNPLTGKLIDPPWRKNIARLIHKTQADVLPIYFHGANSLMFQLAGLLHPRMRTAMLPRELINKSNTTIPIEIGRLIGYDKLKSYDDQALIDHLRMRTYLLRDLAQETSPLARRDASATQSGLAPIIDPQPTAVLAAEIAALPTTQHLVDAGEMQVFYARAAQIPWTLREIGRLREVTFRAVGEGSGKAVDLDIYDEYYLHLFIWNRDKQELVGAYRLGQGDEIQARFGKQGFYTHSLFKYKTRLINKLNPALEMGRSFVRQEYQRSFSPLMLLWKGIAQFVSRHPRYRRLFGPVSISNDYRALSRSLMVDFLRENTDQPELSCDVKPRKPFRAVTQRHPEHYTLQNIDHVSELVSAIEPDAKGIPILLRQYLKLGGRILGFNVDDQFNDALDGLIMVDLLETDPKVLAKYMGKEETERYRLYHRADHASRTTNEAIGA